MASINFNKDDLRNRIHGCWMGKSIGGTLGTPVEGKQEINDITGYTHESKEPLANDDLDLQLVWLRAVRDRGPLGINARVLGEYWLTLIPPPWNEYGICKSNMRAGLLPPLSGMYGNEKWKHSNGAWIRTEIWACLAPGCPDVAIKYAYEDACVDHGNGEGTTAAIFTAAMQSAAFVEHDRHKLIKIGLSKIPKDSRVARSVKIAVDGYKKGLPWKDVRNKLVEDSSDLGWFQAPANVGFWILGLLYGEGDFGKSICTAVNCGDDSDCTGATLGALLGIIYGKDGIPKEWIEPIGERIITVAVDRGSFWCPPNVSVLTDHVMELVPQSLGAFRTEVEVSSEPTSIPKDLNLADEKAAAEILNRSPYAVWHDFVYMAAAVDYTQDPDIAVGEPFDMKVIVENKTNEARHVELIWHLPEGWRVLPSNANHIPHMMWTKRREMKVQIVADQLEGATHHGILEIRTPGRPVSALIPLCFFTKG